MDDLISRQAAIDALNGEISITGRANAEAVRGYVRLVKDRLERLPSAQPERKGRWIKLDMHAHLANHKCTACGQECYVPTCMGEPMYTYCPNCGARMRDE